MEISFKTAGEGGESREDRLQRRGSTECITHMQGLTTVRELGYPMAIIGAKERSKGFKGLHVEVWHVYAVLNSL